MKRIGLVLMICALGAFWTTSAYAARSAKVEAESVEVRQGPSESSPVLETLTKDAAVAASNLPTSGYYKVRTASGVVGWIPADALGLPAESEGEAGGPAPRAVSEVQNQKSAPFQVRAFGGLNFLTSGTLSTAVAVDSLKSAYDFGAEFGYSVSPKIRLVLRGEWLMKSVNVTDVAASTTTRYELKSIPLMAGAQLELFEDSGFSADVALLLGAGLGSKFLVTTAANVPDEQGGTAFAGMGKFNLNYRFSESFGAFAEAGYRYMKVKDIPVTVTTGELSTAPLDLSGVVLGLGIVAFF